MMRRDEEDMNSHELTSLQSDGEFDRIALNDNLPSDELHPSSGREYDPDFESSHTPRNALNSSLTGHSYDKSEATWFDRAKYWMNDPSNTTTVRIGKCLGISVILFIFILLLAAYTRHSDDPPEPRYFPVRLPQTVLPTQYAMLLTASMTTFKFKGEMAMDLVFQQETSEIFFHEKNLDISDVVFISSSGTVTQPGYYGATNQYDLFIVSFGTVFAAGSKGTLHVKFAGDIAPTLAGFYRSTYYTASGENRTIASTQFESTDARRAFPCFDEPAFKASFNISIITEDLPDVVVLSNMPQTANYSMPDGWRRFDFEPSARMSTYLVAYAITDFVSREKATSRGIPVRVWTARDKITGVDVALNAGVASIDRYETFFGLQYPLPKCDMIAIPNFPVGAMENWGLVTYRESALLIFNTSEEAMTEQNIVATVAHELAHQWFGDIVTMAWWNDLWLNEGFASYVEWLGIAAYSQNKWDEVDQAILSCQHSAMGLDSSQYSHAIVQTVNDPAEIDALFDSISYEKGCSVLIQLAEVMGYYDNKPNFQAGLSNYLSAHAYGNAASDDLWNALGATAPSGLPVTIIDFMHKFVQQQGYPVVTLVPDGSGNGFIATQQRFLELPPDRQDPTLAPTQALYRWDLHVTVGSGGNTPTVKSYWFLATDAQIKIPYDSDQEFLFLNSGRYGFYRVNYPADMWSALSYAMIQDENVLNRADFVGIIEDAWELSLAGQANYTSAFEVLQFLKANYAEYTPWAAALSQLARVDRLLDSLPDTQKQLHTFIVSKLINNNTLSSPPWNGFQDHLKNLLQQTFVNALVAYGDAASRSLAKDLFNGFMNQGTAVQVNMRDAVYRVGVEDLGAPAWDFLYHQYSTSLDPSEQRRILRALARSLDANQLTTFLNWSIDQTKIKSQDTTRIIIYVASNPNGKTLTWNWIKSNYDALYEAYGASSFTLSELIIRVIGLFQTQAELTEAQNFFNGKDLGTAKLALSQALESVKVNMYWLELRVSEFQASLATALAQ